jgi:hypothetical protein
VIDNIGRQKEEMGYQQDEFDDTWADLVPEQPNGSNQTALWLVAGAVVIVLICVCSVASFVVVQQFLLKPTTVPTLAVPTLPGSTPEDIAQATLPSEPPPTPIILPSSTPAPPETAPTVTLGVEMTDSAAGIGNVEAVRLPAPPVIDGALTEWAGVPTYVSAFRVYQADGWDGTEDLTAVWRLAWDVTNLYVGVEVTDDIHVQTQSGNQIFRGDGLDIQLDTDREGDFGAGVNLDDFQINFSPGDFAGLAESAWRFQGNAQGQIPDAPGHNVVVRAQKTAAGYVLEAAVPWIDVTVKPEEGMIIGIALNANDNDTPGTAVQEVMMSHVSTRTLTDPSGWGTLTLR